MRTLPAPQTRTTGASGSTATHTSPRVIALGHDFDITCDDLHLGGYLSSLFDPLAHPGTGLHHYRLCVRGPQGSDLWFDDELLCGPASTPRAVAMLLWHINGQVIARSERFVRLHAGGVARAGEAVLLPGEMEAGKSTLTAGLVRAGLDYLSDELIAVDPQDGHVEGFARAISLDPGSWPAFEDVRPELPERLAAALPHQWQVPADSLRSGSVVHHARPAILVAPRVQPGAPLHLERLTPIQALVTLAGSTFDLDGASQRNLGVLAELVEDCPAYRLTFGDLDPAVAAVVDLVHGRTS